MSLPNSLPETKNIQEKHKSASPQIKELKDLCVSVFQVAAQAVLFMCMNTAGIFISYLSDRAQRQAFLETRRCIEARLRLETENQRQVSPRMDKVVSDASKYHVGFFFGDRETPEKVQKIQFMIVKIFRGTAEQNICSYCLVSCLS